MHSFYEKNDILKNILPYKIKPFSKLGNIDKLKCTINYADAKWCLKIFLCLVINVMCYALHILLTSICVGDSHRNVDG